MSKTHAPLWWLPWGDDGVDRGGSSGCDDDDDDVKMVVGTGCGGDRGGGGSAWWWGSDRSVGEKHFWTRPKNSPENFSSGGGGDGRNPAVAAGKSERE
ncbi:hypothetical protein Tco_0404241 [Tanacetum coccineum]